jgi:glycosyltransferase involved in cell wall biosynthesis
MQETGAPNVSVVVPTFNRRSSLQRLLEGLTAQSYPASQFEVIVVDDGSTDGTADFLREIVVPYRLRVLEQPHRGAPAAGRNCGVAEARADLIVFLDDDVVPNRNLLAAHVASHGPALDEVVIGPMSPPAASWLRPAWVRWEEDKLQVQYRAMLAGEYPCTPRQFYTGNASLSRARFLAADGFDANFRRAEDVELGYRLRDRGATFVFDARAEVTHYASRSFDAWCKTPYQYGRYDVAMGEALEYATMEFHGRHILTRTLARLCVGRSWLGAYAIGALRWTATTADRFGAQRTASAALSGIFNLLYWQGICDELGDRVAFWQAIGEGAFRPFRSAAIPRV